MAIKIKNHSTAKRSLLLWIVLLTPVVGLACFMIASHNGNDGVSSWKLTGLALAACWLATYVINRVVKWRGQKGPSSLPPS